MPDLPLDAPPDPDTSVPPASTPEEVHLPAETEEAEASPEVEQEAVEEESTVREEAPSAEPQVEQEEGASAEQQEGSSGEGGEEGVREEEEEGAESAPQAEDVTLEEKEVGEETQANPDSDNPVVVSTNNGAAPMEAPAKGNIPSQEEAAEGPPQEVTEGEERNCVPCTCQSIFSNYNPNAPSRRKNRPCSLPVSELETVIASACGEPETPRSHYIRIHHLLHSLPSAQQRPPSQEEEETGEGENTSTTQETISTSPTLKNSKEEEGQEDEDEEDTTQSPSQVWLVLEILYNIKYIS